MISIALRVLLALFMGFAGVMHFVRPQGFVRIVPPFLPWPYALVYISGFFEVLGAVGLLIPHFSVAAAWGLLALYIAVFPANIYMALEKIPFGRTPTPPILLWLRLPLQFVLMYWVWTYTQAEF